MKQATATSVERQLCIIKGGPCDGQTTNARKSTNVLKVPEPPARKAVWRSETEAVIVLTPPPGILHDPDAYDGPLVVSPPILRDAVYRRVGDTPVFVFSGMEDR